MTTIEQIHNEFDTAVETLVKISKDRQEIADSIEIPQEEKDYQDGVWLKELGFEKTELARKVDEFNDMSSTAKHKKRQSSEISTNINETVLQYQTIFPFHKFILYSQVIKICEKYNLYFGPAQFYQGNIPKKNIEEMKNFPYEKWDEREFNDLHQGFSLSKPVCETAASGGERHGNARHYICAPLNEFVQDGNTTVGKEIYKKAGRDSIAIKDFKMPKKVKLPKDPIILMPVRTSKIKGEVGFIVVTKWGEEANDPGLAVGLNN